MNSAASLSPSKNRRALQKASIVSFLLLILWWGGILLIDSILAEMLPYHEYEVAALLYPDVFYPGLPGWILAHSQPFYLGVYIVAIGWLVALSTAIGAVTTKIAARQDLNPTVTAAGIVVALFVVATTIEAVVILLG